MSLHLTPAACEYYPFLPEFQLCPPQRRPGGGSVGVTINHILVIHLKGEGARSASVRHVIQCKQSEVVDSGKDCWPPWGHYVCTNNIYTYTHLQTCLFWGRSILARPTSAIILYDYNLYIVYKILGSTSICTQYTYFENWTHQSMSTETDQCEWGLIKHNNLE